METWMSQPIITTLLDNDLYKFTMGACFNRREFEGVKLRATFINRGRTPFPDGFDVALRRQLNMVGDLRMTPDEKAYIDGTPENDPLYFLRREYRQWLRQFTFDPSEVKIEQRGGDLNVVTEGDICCGSAPYWEVVQLAIISQLYYQMTGVPIFPNWRDQLRAKGQALFDAGVKFADFGMRRRVSYEAEDATVAEFSQFGKTPDIIGGFVGTSNVHLAMKYGVKPIGTSAHEYYMLHAAVYGFAMANCKAMDRWQDEYGTELGQFLTDSFTSGAAKRDFSRPYAMLYDGLRQDSGDPKAYVDSWVAHYKQLQIDPRTKVIIFSNSLSIPEAIKLNRYCRGNETNLPAAGFIPTKIDCSMGIGGGFTNKGIVPDDKILNIVIKAAAYYIPGRGWREVCKLSDDPGKVSGSPAAIRNAVWELGLPNTFLQKPSRVTL